MTESDEYFFCRKVEVGRETALDRSTGFVFAAADPAGSAHPAGCSQSRCRFGQYWCGRWQLRRVMFRPTSFEFRVQRLAVQTRFALRTRRKEAAQQTDLLCLAANSQHQ